MGQRHGGRKARTPAKRYRRARSLIADDVRGVRRRRPVPDVDLTAPDTITLEEWRRDREAERQQEGARDAAP